MTRFVFLALILVLAVTPAQAERFGDWSTSTSPTDGFFAVTSNDSQQIFGQFCFPPDGNCIWLLSLDRSCTKSDRYAVLINSESGAVSTELVCDIALDSGRHRYFFPSFDDIDRIVRAAPRIGIAIPIKGGTFTVIRFSMRGAIEALAAMHTAVLKRKTPDKSTKDQQL